MPQSILLFNGSVGENIAHGHPDLDRDRLQATAETAREHQLIGSMPDGYDTLVGERGVKLSTGQQQRIALARALVKSPPILILDEATSMFDPAGEDEFFALSEGVFRDRTVLQITHRTASLALADRVPHLANGHVFPTGEG